jgi:uncharacterized protein YndB with AHSA1/START domain
MSTGSTQPRQKASLELTRTFRVPRIRVFQAWTDPNELRKWWQLGHGWKLTVAEVDLRVGGKYRIGLSSTENSSRHHVTGTFQEVSAPERLVYTWNVEHPRSNDESVVTVEFLDKGSSTEVILTHDRLAGKGSRQNTYDGWLIVLDGLARLLG